MKNKARAKACTNIALVKYWGKRDESLFLPMNSSISITLDAYHTITEVEINDESADRFILNGQEIKGEMRKRVTGFLDKVRTISGVNKNAIVNSINHVPTGAGLASSASAFAALSAAASKAYGLELDARALGILARQGSGSACRSIYGGFVKWHNGIRKDGLDSFPEQLLKENLLDVSIISVVVSSKEKDISSRDAMRQTVQTSPMYQGWLDSVNQDLAMIEEAIQNRDYELLGTISEANCLKMHATMMSSKPSIMYWSKGTMNVIEEVYALRKKGILAFFTIDAGPNVKIMCESKNEHKIEQHMLLQPEVESVTICHQGQGITYL